MCWKLPYSDFSDKVCVPNKIEQLALTKHISCECKCRFDGRKCNSDQL